MGAGRPTRYRKEYCKMLEEHMAQGLSYESFAANLKVARQSLYDWEKAHKEFSYSKSIGKELMLSFFEKVGIKAMLGKVPGFNAATYIFTVKNKCGWRDQPESENNDKEINVTYNVLPPREK